MVPVEQLQTGDILICTGKSFISKTIMKATKSTFSHSALYIPSWEQHGVIDSQKDGTNWRPWNEWRGEYEYNYIVFRPIFDFNEKEIAIKAFSKAGNTGYDFISFIFRQPWKLITGSWRNRGNKEKDKMICSEYTSWVWDLPNWWKLTPQDQYEYLSKSEKFKQLNII